MDIEEKTADDLHRLVGESTEAIAELDRQLTSATLRLEQSREKLAVKGQLLNATRSERVLSTAKGLIRALFARFGVAGVVVLAVSLLFLVPILAVSLNNRSVGIAGRTIGMVSRSYDGGPPLGSVSKIQVRGSRDGKCIVTISSEDWSREDTHPCWYLKRRYQCGTSEDPRMCTRSYHMVGTKNAQARPYYLYDEMRARVTSIGENAKNFEIKILTLDIQ